jgi:tRNA-splicing endonuclease subunit Sen34
MYQAVFNDLTNQGYWLTLGFKFGADFLAYEGDPLTCHAKFCVMVLTEHQSTIEVKQLVMAQRIANSVKKDLLIAFGSC